MLARRRESARLLLLGTYRPPEVQHRDHPLQTVKQELQTHGHCVELPLTWLPEEAVAAYLASRFPGLARLDRLAHLVHQRTEGNPLFMVNLVDSWLTQGVLRAQDGAWILLSGVEALHHQRIGMRLEVGYGARASTMAQNWRSTLSRGRMPRGPCPICNRQPTPPYNSAPMPKCLRTSPKP